MIQTGTRKSGERQKFQCAKMNLGIFGTVECKMLGKFYRIFLSKLKYCIGIVKNAYGH